MATYWVTKLGSPTNSGVDEAHAKLAYSDLEDLLEAGDEVVIGDGNYDEGLIPVSGINPNRRTVVRAKNSGMVTFTGATDGGHVLELVGKKNFTSTGINYSAATQPGLKAVVAVGSLITTGRIGSSNIDILHGTITGRVDVGCIRAIPNTSLAPWESELPEGADLTNLRFAYLEIQNGGIGSGQTYFSGIDLHGASCIIEFCLIHDIAGIGANVYSANGSNTANSNILRNNRIWNCGWHGMHLGGGINALAYNNIAFRNGQTIQGSGIYLAPDAHNSGVYSSTLYANSGYGLFNAGALDDEAKNIIAFFNGVGDIGGPFTASNNLTTDPLFVDEAGNDFHLQAGSDAIGAGANLAARFTTDYDGLIRATWDIGAYAYAGVAITHITGTFSVADKVYDGSTNALVAARGLVGVAGGDDVSLTAGTAAFSDAAVGAGKTVTLTGAVLTGAQAYKYTLDSVATTTANILTEITATTSLSCVFHVSPAAPAVSPELALGPGKKFVWLYKMYLDPANGGTKQFATVTTTNQIYEGRIVGSGRVERSIPIPSGLMQISNATIELADTDSAVRQFLRPKTSMRRLCELRLAREGGSAATSPVAFVGEIVNVKFTAGRASVELRDIHSRWLDQTIPPFITRVVGAVDSSGVIDPLVDSSGEPLFPNLPKGVDSVFVPIVLGKNVSPDDNPSGVLKLQLVDTVQNRYVVARHACEDIPAVYRKLAEDENFSVVDSSEYTIVEISDFFEGIHYIITCVQFGAAQPENAEIRADVLGVNLRGPFGFMPQVGFSRNIVDHLINLVYYATLKLPVVARYDVNSWNLVRNTCASEGYTHDYIISEPMTWRACLSQLCASAGIDFFQDKFARLALALTVKSDPLRPVFTDHDHILRNSVQQSLADPSFNKLRYFYARNHATNEWAFSRSRDNDEDQVALGEIQETTLEMHAVRESFAATSGLLLPEEIARQRLKWLGLDSFQFECDMMAPSVITNLELAKLVGYTHYDGITNPGEKYVNEEFKVYSISLDMDRLKYHVKAVRPIDIPIVTATLIAPSCPVADLVVGSFFTTTLVATGGTAPYTWAITGGALPDGITLDADTGVMSGIPTAAGTFDYVFTLTDADGRSASQSCELTVTENIASLVTQVEMIALIIGTAPFGESQGGDVTGHDPLDDAIYESSRTPMDLSKYDAIDHAIFEIDVYDYRSDSGFGEYDSLPTEGCNIWLLHPDGTTAATITTSGVDGAFLRPKTLRSGNFTLQDGDYRIKIQHDGAGLEDDLSPFGTQRGVWLYGARLKIYQANPTKTRIQMPLLVYEDSIGAVDVGINGISGTLANFAIANPPNSTSYGMSIARSYTWLKEDSLFATIQDWTLEMIPTPSGSGAFALFNVDDDTIVADSETTIPLTPPTKIQTTIANSATNFASGTQFELRLKKDDTGNFTIGARKASLWVNLTSLSKTATYNRLPPGPLGKSGDDNYLHIDKRFLYDPAHMPAGMAVYFEVVARQRAAGTESFDVNLADAGLNDQNGGSLTAVTGSDLSGTVSSSDGVRFRSGNIAGALTDQHRYVVDGTHTDINTNIRAYLITSGNT